MSFFRLSFVSVALLALGAFACSKQGEGERCVKSNGNGDCDGDLVCVSPRSNACNPLNDVNAQQNGVASEANFDCGAALCCPRAPARSSVQKCNEYQYGVVEVDAGGGTDAGTP